MRGGLTYGQLYHKGDICFGPAMNRAYELESKIAKYPRIIVDELLINEDMINKFRHPSNSLEFEINFIKGLVKQDPKDKNWYLDYLSQSDEFNLDEKTIETYYNLLKKIKNNIEEDLENYRQQNSKDMQKVIEKYEWYKEYFNRVITEGIKEEYHNEFLIK
ncbi:hypothetical protein [Phascolarctobacterium succinatutens]|uniref:hypothetical protein n=1 Tax=Phascolarctobacterium succinatutens TaxID=626940 RepID=UPI0025D4E5BC|nr:hypothetical protein [Phascolarctobacterium succinatutens]